MVSGVIFRVLTLTKQHAFGPVNLIADWTTDEDFPRYVALDQPANRHAWRRGRKRSESSPTYFRDWKSYGFDLEATKLIHTHRLHTLLLAMATTTLWMVHVGQWVTRTGRRPLLEALHKCDYSIFRLGRDYTCRSQVMDWPLPVGFTRSPPDAPQLAGGRKAGLRPGTGCDRVGACAP